ncbi:MAG: DUF1365 family protein [Gammaproteobacteria bacterium]|nr:DUF1365 family protein [Gammaproteobacteria bacterium]
MNPIILFFCFDREEQLRFVVAEVTNTPWGERHSYVVDLANATPESDKCFHVSPFMPMGTRYHWRISDPGKDLTVSIEVTKNDKRLFTAAMKLNALPLTPGRLVTTPLLKPVKGLAGIYRQALGLWRKRVPLYLHPRARGHLLTLLDRIEGGAIRLRDGNDVLVLGDTEAEPIEVTVEDERFYSSLLWGGSIGAAEAFMKGYWQCDRLTDLIRLIHRNREMLFALNDKAWRRPIYRLRHLINRDTVAGSKKNIGAHYDLGNDLFELFLDPTLTYSSGIFERPDASLTCASTAKLDRICHHLELTPDDHVLEIGTGWGSFSIHAARHYGCRVTTTTISEKQYALARARVAEAGLDDRVTVLKQDYRELDGQYDKLVSIEMIEAVGLDYIGGYFQQCAGLLKPDGRMMIQAITIADQHYDFARKNVDFIQRYIFPGGALPSVTKLAREATENSDLRLYDLVDITEHYAETLRRWRQAFLDNLDEVRRLGYDDLFVRTWHYYFCYCEAGFEERHIGCVQAAFHKPDFRKGLACS